MAKFDITTTHLWNFLVWDGTCRLDVDILKEARKIGLRYGSFNFWVFYAVRINDLNFDENSVEKLSTELGLEPRDVGYNVVRLNKGVIRKSINVIKERIK